MAKKAAAKVISTGPTTVAGKKVASMNATKHGLTAKIWLNKKEEDQYQSLLDAFIEEYQPQTPTEELLVERVANLATRLQRFQSVENALFEEARENAGKLKTVVSSFGCRHVEALGSAASLPAIEAASPKQDDVLRGELNSISNLREVIGYNYVVQHLPETRKKLLANCRRLNTSIPEVISVEAGFHISNVIPFTMGSTDEDYKEKTDDELDRTGLRVKPEALQAYVRKQIERLRKKTLIAEVVEGYEHRRDLLIGMAMPSPDVMDRLMRYHTSLDRQFSKALGELLHVIDRRKPINNKQ